MFFDEYVLFEVFFMTWRRKFICKFYSLYCRVMLSFKYLFVDLFKSILRQKEFFVLIENRRQATIYSFERKDDSSLSPSFFVLVFLNEKLGICSSGNRKAFVCVGVKNRSHYFLI